MLKAAGANSQGSASSLARHAARKFPLRRLAVVGLLAAAVLFYGKEAMWAVAGLYRGGGPRACAELVGFPRVALLFLTRGDLPHAELWGEWLGDAAGLIPSARLKGKQCRKGPLREVRQVCAAPSGAGPADRQFLFTVYVHPHPEFPGFDAGSTFHGHDVPDRIQTAWGGASLVDAAKVLLRAALLDRTNQKFVLLSESCIPLYPPTLVYQQLMAEDQSRVNACRGWWVAEHEWVPELAANGTNLTYRSWRKSPQWFGLQRSHAEVIVRDTQLMEVFRKHCRPHFNERQKRWRQCFVDEHYIPTVLAVEGLDNETDCHGGLLSTDFTVKNSTHPIEYQPEAITSTLLLELRQNVFFGKVPKPKDPRQGPPRDQCHSEMAIKHAWHGFTHCPLFARKFGNATVAAVLAAMHSCLEPAPDILSGCE